MFRNVLICCVLFALCGGILLQRGESNLRIRRRARASPQFGVHYRHNPLDYAALETIFNVGTPSQLGQFIVDTTRADLEVTVCSREDPPAGDQPCFNRFLSSSFHHTSALTGNDRLDSALLTNDYAMPNVTFVLRNPQTTNTGRIGCAWPSLRQHPDDTFFPLEYLKHWKRNQFSIALALNGCEGLLDWGNTQNCPDSSATHYVPLTSFSYWQFALTGFEFGEFKETILAQALVDTNKEFIGMPKRFLAKMMAAYSIRYDGLYGAYTVECDAEIPDFCFTAGGTTLTIRRAQLIYTEEPLPNGRCAVNFASSANEATEFYFGLPIMTSYCTSFDYDGKRIGFTPNTLMCHNCHCHDHQLN